MSLGERFRRSWCHNPKVTFRVDLDLDEESTDTTSNIRQYIDQTDGKFLDLIFYHNRRMKNVNRMHIKVCKNRIYVLKHM